MGIKFSTGRGTKVRHSTALEWDDLEKTKKKYTPIKYSTSKDSPIRHATGVEFDFKYLAEKEKAEGDDYLGKFKEPKPIRTRVRSKAKGEGDEYLERFYEAMAKGTER